MEVKATTAREKMKVHVLISGKVQGVFFRAHTSKKAKSLGLKGWVKNRDDGKVEAFFEGPKDKAEQMIKWCWQGPKLSRVTSVDSIQLTKTGEKLKEFEIRY